MLTPVLFTAYATWASGQTPPPAQNPDLPTVIKPKSATPQPKPETSADSDAEVVDPAKPKDDKTIETQNRQFTTDPAVANPDANVGPDYTGPSILSRGMNFVRPTLPANESFRPFAGVNFYHDSGVTGQYQGPLAPVTEQSFTGAELSFGVSGQHSRRLDTFELDYRGHVYVNGYSSQDHALTFGYSRVLSRHLHAVITETAGLYANNYAVLNSVATTDTSIANTALVVTPNTESFDDRTYYSSTQADVAYIKSSRLSFDVGMAGFLVKRQTANLISANGYQIRSDAAYRITKRSTVGPYYAYSRYYYSGTFGDSGIHTIGFNYSFALSKRTEFRFRFGGSRLETRGLQTVILLPQIAQILGFPLGIQRYYAVTYSPDFAIDLNRTFRRGVVTVSYLQGISPGNGVILTSRRDSVNVNYSYNGLRRFGLNFAAGRDALGSVAQQIGTYSSYYGRISLSHPLSHGLQSTLNFDYRKLGFTSNTYARDQYRISLGLAWSPGPGPLKFW